ncbi:MAG TPA: hypothetical protein VK897_19490 [Anaerolineales bacterium]|nr:hypothetical protein [Anaerolineales bacterium]
MDTWFSKSLGDAIYGGDLYLEDFVHPSFLQAFKREGEPSNMAVFTRLESEGRLHCDLVIYFSPAAHEVADLCGAEPCDKPAQVGLKLFAGDERAWSALFREEGG